MFFTQLEDAIYRYLPLAMLAKVYVKRDGALSLWEEGEEASDMDSATTFAVNAANSAGGLSGGHIPGVVEAAVERAAIVAWLRSTLQQVDDAWIADAIERGEHIG